MNNTRVWIHLMWSTKYRQPFLRNHVRYKVFDHIRHYAEEAGITLDRINGHMDHVHCLIALQPEQAVARVVRLLKEESAFWINKEKLMPYRFEWEDDYMAASISQADVPTLRGYIKQQEKHHYKLTFEDEFKSFVKEHEYEYSR